MGFGEWQGAPAQVTEHETGAGHGGGLQRVRGTVHERD
jgi:hypothetical protein